MIQVKEPSDIEINEILNRVGYGHLACSRDDQPYVIPVHYAFDGSDVFIYTTEGKKFEIIKDNPRVCLQVEEVTDNEHWQSVIVDGLAEQIMDTAEREKALKHILAVNPKLTPAVSIRWMDSWVRENIPVVYRLTPTARSGRCTVNKS